MVRHTLVRLAAASAGVLLACAAAPAALPPRFSLPKLDTHGDLLPPGAVARLGTVRFRHIAPVLAAAFSPDGKTLFATGPDNMTCEWDVATGRQRSVKIGIGLYRPAEGRRLLTPDGRTQITVRNGRVVFADGATAKELPGLDALATAVSDLTLTPGGKQLVTASEDVRVWDVATRRERIRFTGHTGSVHAVAVSPDGRRAASTGWDRTLLVWDFATGKILGREHLLNPNPGSSPAFSPDGKTLIVPDGGHALVFRDAATGKRVQPPAAAEAFLSALAAAPDGKTVAIASYDGTVAIWDIKTAKRIQLLTHDRGGTALAFSPDGRLLAASGTAAASAGRLWDTRTGKELCRLAAPESADRGWHVSGLTFTADGRRLTCLATGRVFTWDVPSGGLVMASPPRSLLGEVLSPDGDLVASTGLGAEWFFMPNMSGSAAPSVRPPETLTDTISLRDGVTSAERVRMSVKVKTGSSNAAILRRGHMLARGSYGRFSPDGRLVLAPRLGAVRVWELASGRLLGEFPGRFGDERAQVAERIARFGLPREFLGGRMPNRGPFPLDARGAGPLGGGWSATAPRDFGLIGGQLLLNQADTLRDALFAPDGRTLLLARRDGQLLEYDVATGKERRRWTGVPNCPLRALSPDGRWLITGEDDAQVLVWDLGRAEARDRQSVTPGEAVLETLWAELGAEEPARAYRAIAQLSASPRAIAFLNERLRSRATSAEDRLAGLVRGLDDPKFAVREAAARALKAAGASAYDSLRIELGRNPSLEQCRRIEGLLATLPVADRLIPKGKALRAYRAVQVLEWAGSPAARAVLARLADGPAHAAVTRQARQALARLTRGAG